MHDMYTRTHLSVKTLLGKREDCLCMDKNQVHAHRQIPHVFWCVYIEACMYVCIHVCMYVCAAVHALSRGLDGLNNAHVNVHLRIHVCAYVCMHACMKTHTHTHTVDIPRAQTSLHGLHTTLSVDVVPSQEPLSQKFGGHEDVHCVHV